MSRSQVLETDTIANLYADLNSKVIVQAGPLNTPETLGTLYNVLIPRRLAAHAKEAAEFVSTNWNGSRHSFNAYTTIESKIEAFEKYMETWTPKEASLHSPVEQAMLNELTVKYADRVANSTGAAIDAAFLPLVHEAMASSAQTEARSRAIEDYLLVMRAWSEKRIRRDGSGKIEKIAASLGDVTFD
jgi:hypothetical protein